MNDINIEFTDRMREELEKNHAKKGDFNDWKPSKEKLMVEIDYHLYKLKHAVYKDVDPHFIREATADLANYMMKMYEIADKD